MPRHRSDRTALAAVAGIVVTIALQAVGAQSDLDAFMRQVMERRDDNWKKLQQYILDQTEEVDIRGPGKLPLWGQRSEYTWFIRDGFFVRSPLKINGVTVGEDDRRKAEADYLRRTKEREEREKKRDAARSADSAVPPTPMPADLGGFIQQTSQPEFVSTAYFLRFKFDEGRYALVGRDTLDGRSVLRIEYYPSKLFADDPDRDEERRGRDRDDQGGRRRAATDEDKRVNETINRLLNKGSRVTLWIESSAHQILKYTFDNVDVDFFPAQWLASVSGLHATMTMGQPFQDIWLPDRTDIQAQMMTAIGEVDVRFTVSYHDYRQAEVTTGIRVPGGRKP